MTLEKRTCNAKNLSTKDTIQDLCETISQYVYNLCTKDTMTAPNVSFIWLLYYVSVRSHYSRPTYTADPLESRNGAISTFALGSTSTLKSTILAWSGMPLESQFSLYTTNQSMLFLSFCLMTTCIIFADNEDHLKVVVHNSSNMRVLT